MTAPDLPLAGRTVLITRAPDRARSFAGLLEGLGARVVVAPVTTTAPPESPAALDAAMRSLDDYAWVAVTSVNAVDALRDAAARTATPLSPGLSDARKGEGSRGSDNSMGAAQASMEASGPRWAAVGPATSRALHAAGVPVSLEATGTAADLAAHFPALPNLSDPRQAPPLRTSDAGAGRNRRVLLPLGDLARSVLADGLVALGWDVHTVIAYRTVPLALPDDVVDAARGGTIDLGVVAAGSAARELARQLGDAAPAVVAIGQPSAEAAVAAGLSVVGVAERPTDDGLAAALVAAAGGGGRSAADHGGADHGAANHDGAVHSAARTTGTAPTTDRAPTTRSDT